MRTARLLVCFIAAAWALTLAIPAGADTVYLKNGRRIDSSSVRVEGDRVVVRLYGGEVTFPMSVVERIEENTAVEPPSIPARGPAAQGPDETAQSEETAIDPDAAGEPAAGEEPSEESEESTPPEETREYWQNRLAPLRQQLDAIDGNLAELRTRTGAEVQVQIARLEQRRTEIEGQVDAITTEARRLGVPPGWLRMP